MKYLFNYILCSLAIFLGVSCSEHILEESVEKQKGRIVLDFSTDLIVSRAIDDLAHEYALEHLDILIYEYNGDFKYHERVNNPSAAANDGQGQVTLGITVDQFESQKKYWVYVIANSNQPSSAFDNKNRDALQAIVETSNNLHLTGLELNNVPSSFLMDGIAFLGDANATEPTQAAAINLTSVSNQTVSLKVVLRRAASKIVVTFTPGTGVTFNPTLVKEGVEYQTPGYYVRNLPVKANLLKEKEELPVERTIALTTETPSGYFVWNKGEGGNYTSVVLTMYVYSHSWKPSEVFANGTNLVVDIPMNYDSEEYPDNYYQIPLSKPHDSGYNDDEILRFDRNTYYAVNVTIGAPGASSVHTPVTVEPIEFSVLPWTEKPIDVGGVSGPKFLKVNREEMEMYYVSEDQTTLRFASSSAINDITVSDVYYIDKYGQRRNISNFGSYNISASVENGALSGNITVKSDLPTNNTIRYFTLTITNADGLSRTVDVMQYPLIYITNIRGWYSYRDDFMNTNVKPTTYVYKGDGYVNVSLKIENGEWKGNYEYKTNYNNGFWRSKVAGDIITQEDADESKYDNIGNDDVGKAYLYYYHYNNSNSVRTISYGLQNTRMYHVRVTSTSDEYIVGNPRLNDEVTERTGANAKLVAPSFMIASRLGFVTSGGGNIGYAKSKDDLLKLYENHCKNYVEVYKDENGNPVEFHDWRLPTEAEIGIIIGLQGYSNQQADAIDYLLNADFYMSATGPVFNTKNQDGDSKYEYTEAAYNEVAGRCVRTALANNISTTNE